VLVLLHRNWRRSLRAVLLEVSPRGAPAEGAEEISELVQGLAMACPGTTKHHAKAIGITASPILLHRRSTITITAAMTRYALLSALLFAAFYMYGAET